MSMYHCCHHYVILYQYSFVLTFSKANLRQMTLEHLGRMWKFSIIKSLIVKEELNAVWQKDKLLIMSNFTFCHNVFKNCLLLLISGKTFKCWFTYTYEHNHVYFYFCPVIWYVIIILCFLLDDITRLNTFYVFWLI